MPLGFMGVKGVVSPLPAAAFESTGAVGAGASRPMGDSSFFRFAISAFGRGLCLKIASNLLDRLAQGEAGGEGAGG